ncbi:hypothetical protein ACU8KH_03403 [Lachancea thermotolerans]
MSNFKGTLQNLNRAGNIATPSHAHFQGQYAAKFAVELKTVKKTLLKTKATITNTIQPLFVLCVLNSICMHCIGMKIACQKRFHKSACMSRDCGVQTPQTTSKEWKNGFT